MQLPGSRHAVAEGLYLHAREGARLNFSSACFLRCCTYTHVHSRVLFHAHIQRGQAMATVILDPMNAVDGNVYSDYTIFGTASPIPLTIVNAVHIYHMVGGFGAFSRTRSLFLPPGFCVNNGMSVRVGVGVGRILCGETHCKVVLSQQPQPPNYWFKSRMHSVDTIFRSTLEHRHAITFMCKRALVSPSLCGNSSSLFT
jgi:hypothetical protein